MNKKKMNMFIVSDVETSWYLLSSVIKIKSHIVTLVIVGGVYKIKQSQLESIMSSVSLVSACLGDICIYIYV